MIDPKHWELTVEPLVFVNVNDENPEYVKIMASFGKLGAEHFEGKSVAEAVAKVKAWFESPKNRDLIAGHMKFTLHPDLESAKISMDL